LRSVASPDSCHLKASGRSWPPKTVFTAVGTPSDRAHGGREGEASCLAALSVGPAKGTCCCPDPDVGLHLGLSPGPECGFPVDQRWKWWFRKEKLTGVI
jgi:hypothetical protein